MRKLTAAASSSCRIKPGGFAQWLLLFVIPPRSPPFPLSPPVSRPAPRSPPAAAGISPDPSAETPTGDPAASGTPKISVDDSTLFLCYQLATSGVGKATMAHVHKAAKGASGPPVVTLDTPLGGASKACAKVDVALAKAIIAKPSDYYVNVHTEKFPAGAIRGQLANWPRSSTRGDGSPGRKDPPHWWGRWQTEGSDGGVSEDLTPSTIAARMVPLPGRGVIGDQSAAAAASLFLARAK